MEDSILQMKNVSFSYGEESQALKNISVNIKKNEKIAVLGENGAGKSTFFLNLNGVRKPDEGDIFLYGNKIGKKTRNQLRKSVGIVFQDADSQIIASTVKAEVAFGPLNLKIPKEEVEDRVKKAIHRLQLQELKERPPHYLSGGEKKRVSIADILAMESEIIIFDEPTASLDPLNADLLEDILRELGEEGKTILLSTHDVDFAYRFAERILVFSNGVLVADGRPLDIFQDKEVLQMAHLKKPLMMQIYELLEGKNIVTGECPKTFEELEKIIKEK